MLRNWQFIGQLTKGQDMDRGPFFGLRLVSGMVLFLMAAHLHADTTTLTIGSGDASLSVLVDAYGAFGSAVSPANDAIYNPVGPLTAAGTVFESGIAFGTGGPRSFIAEGDIGGSGNLASIPFSSTTTTTAASSFTFGGLNWQLSQAVSQLGPGGSPTGALLTQTYTITNNGATPVAFDVVRYLDGDLDFDFSISDGGGTLNSGAAQTLFETDSGGTGADDVTFVGIRGIGGTINPANRWEIDSFSDLRSDILAGNSLINDIELADGAGADPDADFDNFIDAAAPYDVTLAMRNEFSLGAGESATFSTLTFFGNQPISLEVPEPASIALWSLMGLAVVGFAYRFRRKK
jgi:hypothetical protein